MHGFRQHIFLFFILTGCAAQDGFANNQTCLSTDVQTGAPGCAGNYYWPQQKGDHGCTGNSPFSMPDISKGLSWSWIDPHHNVIRATPLIDKEKNRIIAA